MAMAAIGLSTNLRDLKNMGYKPFIVGFIAMATVGIISVGTIEIYKNFFSLYKTSYTHLKLKNKKMNVSNAAIMFIKKNYVL